jgi:hypothetical protein
MLHADGDGGLLRMMVARIQGGIRLFMSKRKVGNINDCSLLQVPLKLIAAAHGGLEVTAAHQCALFLTACS